MKDELHAAYQSMICSVSGWRKIFAENEESQSKSIAPVERQLLEIIARVFCNFLKKRDISSIILGMDRRPTSAPIAKIMQRIFLAEGMTLYRRSACPSPEIMAYSGTKTEAAFCYITASHNPIGYNGMKFGRAGMVFEAVLTRKLIADFDAAIHDATNADKADTRDAPISAARSTLSVSRTVGLRSATQKAYIKLLKNSILFSDLHKQQMQGKKLPISFSPQNIKRNIGVLIDANGSARGKGIDKKLLAEWGIRAKLLNPNKVCHSLLPEGDAMKPCMTALEKLWQKDSRFMLGYVSDADGDRGNIVAIDPTSGKASALSAQDNFALICFARLACAKHIAPKQKLAIVVNAASSQKVVDIAAAFQARCIITETGEANVIAGVHQAERQGYYVCVAGEGSNGGSIMPPNMVRDPLAAIASLALFLTGTVSQEYPIEDSSGNPSGNSSGSVHALLKKLPKYHCNSIADSRSALRFGADNGKTVQNYLDILMKELKTSQPIMKTLSSYGIADWKYRRYVGDRCFDSLEPSGGHVLQFLDSNKSIIARMWMRPSGTEPLFRIMVDLRQQEDDPENTELFDLLFNWQQNMLQRAASS